MSRRNTDKPFYVDVGTSLVAIRCASNHDVLMRYDYELRPNALNFAKGMCDRMNREVELSCRMEGREMSDVNQETIEDIVADIRAQNQGLPEDSYALSPQVCDLLSLADRIEAAWKREREAGAEAAQICGKIGEMIGREAACKQSVTDCNRLGNAAKMREALKNIAKYAKSAAWYTDDAHLLGYLNQIERCAEAALATPPRNCDRSITAKDALKAFERETGESMAIEFIKWLFAEAKGEAK